MFRFHVNLSGTNQPTQPRKKKNTRILSIESCLFNDGILISLCIKCSSPHNWVGSLSSPTNLPKLLGALCFPCNQHFELEKNRDDPPFQPTNQPTQLGEKKRKVLNLQPVAVATLCSSFFFGKKWPTAKIKLQVHAKCSRLHASSYASRKTSTRQGTGFGLLDGSGLKAWVPTWPGPTLGTRKSICHLSEQKLPCQTGRFYML